MDKNNEILFEIENSSYLSKAIAYMMGGVILYSITLFKDRGNELAKTIAASAFGFGFFRFINYKKEKENLKVKFTKDEIILPFEGVNLKIDEIKEIYKVSSIYFDVLRKLRLGTIGKLVSIISFPVIFISSIPRQIVKSIYYKKKLQFYDVLVLIGKDDSEHISIHIPLQNEEEQKNLENYCMEYLNIDITKLKSIWFIPE